MLGNVAGVCRRPLEGRLNWHECEKESERKREREGEKANETPGGRGTWGGHDMEDREGERGRRTDR